MPGGGQTIKTGDEFVYTLPNYRFFVHLDSGESVPVDKYELFSTLPRSYVAVSYHTLPKFFRISNSEDQELISETYIWLKNRLTSLGYKNVSHLEIKGFINRIHIKNSLIKKTEEELIFDEMFIEL